MTSSRPGIFEIRCEFLVGVVSMALSLAEQLLAFLFGQFRYVLSRTTARCGRTARPPAHASSLVTVPPWKLYRVVHVVFNLDRCHTGY